MAKKETAEQKLLKMIETSQVDQKTTETKKSTEQKTGLLSIVKNANKFLFIAVIVAGVWLFFEVSTGAALLSSDVSVSVDQSRVSRSARAVDTAPAVQRLSYYLSGVKKRNIFQPYADSKSKNIVEVAEGNSKAARQAEALRLVGISWLDTIESASVMLEDTDKDVTYFLMSGEKVGDISVKTIYADSVELGYENEEIIIRYDKPQL